MDRTTFKAAVKAHQQILSLERAIKVVIERPSESMVFEGNSANCAVSIKAQILGDLESQLLQAKAELNKHLA